MLRPWLSGTGAGHRRFARLVFNPAVPLRGSNKENEMLKSILPAAFIAAMALTATPASAATPAPAAAGMLKLQLDVNTHDVHRRGASRYRYTPGRRYRRAPAGWRRYGARPGNWRARGCVIVGPVWFCP
jgi:hypothetical protein